MAWYTLITAALSVVISRKPVMAVAPLIDCAIDKPMDVVFLVDSSASVAREGFESMHRFILSVSTKLSLGTGPAKVRVAVAHFSDSVTKTIGFKEGTSLPVIEEKLAKADFEAGGTYLARGLVFVRENILTSARDREAITMLIVLTDGETSDSSALSDAAVKIRNDGVVITAVNIANGNVEQLLSVVGGHADRVRRVDDFEDLSTLVAKCTTTATTTTTKTSTSTSASTTTTTTRTSTTTSASTTTTTSSTTTSTSTTTTTTSSTTTTKFSLPPYLISAFCATLLGLICACMCMIISCSRLIAQQNQAWDVEDVETTPFNKE